ncbi:MAG: 3-phosphoserine/phosphohydroxythreonine transaminase [Planctomycetes bacterium]|nr:3-phosphoserine/phosphohydroxythreonine transaminase [Planctomycetota bacterium]
MTPRAHNFGAGPAVLPVEVLTEAREALLSFGDTGVGILELSHRSDAFVAVREEAAARLRRLAGAGDDWAVLFLQGGASLQFHMVPLNLGADADYVVTGVWAQKAYEEARRLGPARVAATTEGTGHDRLPDALDVRPGAAFVHYTSNNTIYGTQWPAPPGAGVAPLVCDASSDIFSRPLDLARHALVYAGAQKNLGPAGVTVVLARRDLLARSAGRDLPPMLDYAVQARHDSSYNTCPTFGIYVVGLVARWLEAQGGLAALAERNAAKATRVYAALDAAPHLYRGHARPEARSLMNVTFRLRDEALERRFLSQAEARGLVGLKGHRTLGGLRASLYNALPDAAVDALVSLLEDFARENG